MEEKTGRWNNNYMSTTTTACLLPNMIKNAFISKKHRNHV